MTPEWLPKGFMLGAIVGGAYLFWRGFRDLRIQRLLEATPTSNLRSMAMGMVEVEGVVHPRSRVVAPFSGRPCAYWEIEIATQSERGRNGAMTRWSTVHHDRSGHPFYLDDRTGAALVYPQGADVKLPFGVEEQTPGLGVPQMYMDYMAERGLNMRHIWAMGPMRFRERTLEEGMAVHVLGRAYPRAMAMNISQDEMPLAATGTDGPPAHVREFESRSHGVLRRGPGDPVFLIGTNSEKALTAEYGWRAMAGVIGGPLLTLGGLWALLTMWAPGQ